MGFIGIFESMLKKTEWADITFYRCKEFSIEDVNDLHETLGDAETMDNCEPAYDLRKICWSGHRGVKDDTDRDN